MLERIISLLIGYACGHFMTGFFYGKTQHVDLRQVGSGNVGTTNTLRNLGWKAGLVTFAGDVLKVWVAVLVIWLMYHKTHSEDLWLLQYYSAFGAILGHNFPIYMHFKGGKGIACTAGLVLIIYPLAAPLCLALFIGSVVWTKYVSVGSILVVVGFFLQILFFGSRGMLPVCGIYLYEAYALSAVVMLLGIGKHHQNIKRLLNGTENKFSMKSKSEKAGK